MSGPLRPCIYVSGTVTEIMAPQWGDDLDLLGSRDVISHVTVRLAVVNFLWMVHCDHASIRQLLRYEASNVGRKDGCTHGRTNTQVILYWTDKKHEIFTRKFCALL